MPTPITSLAPLNLVTPSLPVGTTVLSVDSSVLPFVIDADTNTTRIEIGIYNTVYALNSFTLAGAFNKFVTSIPLLLTIPQTNVQIIGRNYDPNFAWQASTSYASGVRYADPNGNVQVVVQSGTTGLTQPTWQVLHPVSATAVTVLNNVLTVQSANSFTAGQQVYLSGFENATFLNGVVVTVATPGVTQFTAPLNVADYPTAADAGTCKIVTADNGVLWANVGSIAITPTVKFSLLSFQSNLSVVIAPPSGISALKNQNTCAVQWVTPDYPGFIGVRVMISTDPAGINPPFTQYGDLVNAIASSTTTTIASQTNTSSTVPVAQITNVALTNNLLTIKAINTFTTGSVVSISNLVNAPFLNGEDLTIITAIGTQFTAAFTGQNYSSTPDTGTATSLVFTQTTTTTSTVMTTNYSTVTVPASSVNGNIFYAMLSTVIQDPNTNAMYESVQNGPLLCGFVNLRVTSPTNFLALQRKEDIAGRIIGQINRQLPTLDLSPHSEIRDVFVDPFSIETANMSIREWFSRVAESISAISQVDNVSGNGISDPFQSSPYKQQIARAYGLSANDTQTLINEQFDILGESAGLTRLPAATSTVVLTFYTFQQPQQSITIPEGAVVATVSDANTASLNFTVLGSAVIDVNNLASFFNTTTGWWAVSVPAQCNTTGSVGNVGAGTIRQVISGIPTGINVTNQVGATFGDDQESNAAFAARIQARTVTGIDSSSANGYLVAALSTPGIISAQVVAAGDLEMLRDWDPTRQKHVFGAVDIYVRGTTLSQNNEFIPFQYANNGTYGVYQTYATLAFLGGSKFQIQNFKSLPYLPYDAVELFVSRATNSFYLALDRAQFDNAAGTINLNIGDIAYQYVGTDVTQAKVPLVINGNPATNQAAIAALTGASIGTYTLQLLVRLKSPFLHTPSLQPVLQVYSVTGSATETASVPSGDISLIHTSDFLLNGGSNDAGDLVQIQQVSGPVTKTLAVPTLLSPTLIDVAMDQPLDANGNPLDVISVRSTDQSTLYKFGVDYGIAAFGPYHQYAIQPLTSSVAITKLQITSNVLTVTAANEFGTGAQITLTSIVDPAFGALLNNQIVTVGTASATQFTATFINPNLGPTTTTGQATGSAIQAGQQVLIAYNRFVLYERLTFVAAEQQVVNGTLPTTLNNDGFIRNTWLPQSYTIGIPTFPVTQNGYQLILDGWNGSYGIDGGLDIPGSQAFDSSGLVGNSVPYASRYIKVTYFNGVVNVLMKENIDYTLTVDSISGAATIARILTGHIPDGGTVSVSYFVNETFVISTQYPTFVEMLANTIAKSKSASADVLVKAMVANPVDITLAVTLNANTSPETVDPVIRTVINIVLDNSARTLFQSALVQQIQNITGVQSVEIPLIKCAKSDGSYDIGTIVPTGTKWILLSSDPEFAGITTPKNSWITVSPVLPDSTKPSGGDANAIVDVLYQDQVFQRTASVQEFLTTALSVPHLAVAPGATFDSPGSFYIIGTNDQINASTPLPESYAQKIIVTIPQDLPNPGNLAYFVTYQVFNEGGSKNVTVSPTEYLSPGTITINYVTAG